MAMSMSWSLGWGFLLRRAAAARIWPLWQEPHWGSCSVIHAFCTGWELSGDSPSIVVMGWLVTADAGMEQERMGLPLSRTVQAPHWAIPQPNFVPVRPMMSRMTQRSGIFSSASIVVGLPLML